MNVFNIVIAGVGGQGVLMASKVLAESALKSGMDVKQNEVHVAILQASVDLPRLVSELLKQILRLPSALQTILEIGNRRGQLGRSQQSVCPLDRYQPLCLLQCAL